MNSYLPPEWKDEERMRVLMGPMPAAKDSVALNSRITFWTAALCNWSHCKEEITFTLNDAQMAFRWGTQVPACFPQIFDHLLKQGDFITYDDLSTSANDAESWGAWSKRVLIATPSKWAWKTLQSTVGARKLENQTFIHWKVLQERSDRLLSTYWGTLKSRSGLDAEGVTTVEELFRCLNASLPLTIEGLNTVLLFLAQKRKIAVVEHHGTSLVKLAKPGQTESVVITEMEVAEHQLRLTETKLKQRLESVRGDATSLREEAKNLVLSGLRSQALSVLRRKKRCEKSMEVALSALENVSSCLSQIQESKLNIHVLNAFRLGADALKSSIASSGGADQVCSAMDSIQEVLDECQDITDTLSFGVTSSVDSDEAGLELELKDLLEDSTPPMADAADGYGLPEIPQTSPQKSLPKDKENIANYSS